MINFDSLTLKAFLNEIKPILVLGRVQKIQQPSKYEILLSIRSGGNNYKLYICVNPKYPHVSLVTEAGSEYREIEIPQKPLMFCMLLRKYMEGTKIREIYQPDYERILEIHFDGYNELGAKEPLILACEFMGKHSNVILYSYKNNVILGSAHVVGAEKSREREVACGMPYMYPPKQKKIDLLKINKEEFFKLVAAIPKSVNIWLNENFHNISLALANEFCKITEINTEKDKIIAINKEKIDNLYQLAIKTLKLENLNPSISVDNKLFSLIGLDPDIKWGKKISVNEMIDLYFSHKIYLGKFSELELELLKTVKKELKKQKTKYSRHLEYYEFRDKAEKYRQYADILMANINKTKTGMASIELENFFEENRLIIIPLDPAISPNANIQKYYKLYNKAKNAAKMSENLMIEIQNDINYIESIKISINQAESLSGLKEIKEELISQNILKYRQQQVKSSEKSSKEFSSLTQFTSSDNYKIYLGKNNKQNDYLISKIASPNDIWLHVQNMPGSHVLIKIPPENSEIPEATLHEAANIAAYYSSGRDSSNIPVIYTRRKFLKKPPASKPGYVTYSHEKTLFVNPDKDLILL